MSEVAAAPADPGATIRSKSYRVLLVLAALLGVLVSFASWCFLELVHWIQQEVYQSLPSGLGLHPVPWWWPLPVLAVAGVLAAVAIIRLPGHGGHIPYEGIKAGATQPADLPGILLAALATLGLGLVLGPEAPLIAFGSGLAVLAVRRVKKDTPDQAMAVLAASAAFAAIATVFGSPVIGAIILIEAAGLGGPMLPLILLPGLMSAGIGSVIFIGMGHWTGLSSAAYSLSPISLPAFSTLTAAEFGWAIVLAVAAALAVFAITDLARRSARVVARQPWLLIPAAALAVAGLAIGFAQITHQPADTVLFSGQDAFGSLIKQGTAAVPVHPGVPAPVQGPGLEHLARQLPRRPDLPGPVHRRGRGPARRAPARVLRNPRRGRADGRRGRVHPGTPAVSNHHHPAADLQSRNRHRPADHRRRRGRLPHHPDAIRDPRPRRAHPARPRPATRRTLAHHRNGKPRRRSDMTTRHNPCRHRPRPPAPDRAGRGTIWRRDAARSEDPCRDRRLVRDRQPRDGCRPVRPVAAQARLHEQAIVGAWC